MTCYFKPFHFQNKRAQVDISTLSNDTSSSKFGPTGITFANQTDITTEDDSSCHMSSFICVSVLLCGIILARFGLWVSDLTVTQILQVMFHSNVQNNIKSNISKILHSGILYQYLLF